MPQERLYRTEAIVLRQTDFGEADRILSLLTPRGKFSAIAKGVRRPTSRKAGHLELFARTNLLVARGRNLDIITQAEASEAFESLKTDLLRFTYACYAAELIERLAQEEEDDGGALFELLLGLLRWLERERDPAVGLRHFELRLLDGAGYAPQLFTCVSCAKAITEQVNYFSAEQGGLLCTECGASAAGVRAVSVNAQKVLRYLQKREVVEVRALWLAPATHAEVESVLLDYIEHVLEREVKSATFLRRLRLDLQRLAAGEQSSASVERPKT